jgi:hypothetical protein
MVAFKTNIQFQNNFTKTSQKTRDFGKNNVRCVRITESKKKQCRLKRRRCKRIEMVIIKQVLGGYKLVRVKWDVITAACR